MMEPPQHLLRRITGSEAVAKLLSLRIRELRLCVSSWAFVNMDLTKNDRQGMPKVPIGADWGCTGRSAWADGNAAVDRPYPTLDDVTVALVSA